MSAEILRVPALAIVQSAGRTLYSFAIDGKRLPDFAAVSRVKRDEQHEIAGYQRAESIAHIRTIRKYLESADAMLPNALVVAFDMRVSFEPGGSGDHEQVTVGELVVPIDASADEHEKPGWIVDGQQRMAAIREADVDQFPVYVTAFITSSVAEQRSQFILVNSAKPLPKGLIHELLPATPVEDLPPLLLKKRYPAVLLERLNYEQGALQHRIRTPTMAAGTIKDNSILKMLAASIEDGALYHWFDPETGEGDTEAMLTLLKNYWEAVAATFADAWKASPRRSRLVHGVGILAMGALMDEIAYELRDEEIPCPDAFQRELERISDRCAWMSGVWPLARDDNRRWNELQNTPRDIKALTDYLLRLYRRAVRRGGEALAA